MKIMKYNISKISEVIYYYFYIVSRHSDSLCRLPVTDAPTREVVEEVMDDIISRNCSNKADECKKQDFKSKNISLFQYYRFTDTKYGYYLFLHS